MHFVFTFVLLDGICLLSVLFQLQLNKALIKREEALLSLYPGLVMNYMNES